MESPMPAMLDGSGGAAQAGWTTRPARPTASAKMTMRATRPICVPLLLPALTTGLVRPTDRHAMPPNRPCQPLGCRGRSVLSAGMDVAEHDPHHVVGRVGAVVLAVQAHHLSRGDRGHRVPDAG